MMNSLAERNVNNEVEEPLLKQTKLNYINPANCGKLHLTKQNSKNNND